MHKNRPAFRLGVSTALAGMLWNTALPLAAVAQPAPPPLAASNQGRPDLTTADPPARVGRIAGITGSVSFHNPGDTDWTAASVNFPVSNGNTFWTDPSARAQMEVSACRVAMAGGTQLDVTTLDASGMQVVEEQGETYLHLDNLAPNETWSIQTPRGLITINAPGRYEIAAGSTDQPTLVSVVDGSAQVSGPGVSLQVLANQTATITGTDTFQGGVGPLVRDSFLVERLNVEQPPPPPPGMPQQVVAMAGGEDLAAVGSWGTAPEYGSVWYPPVDPGWVPYRHGHWAFVAPWGWTWVDDATWGFAPFHYGRWIQLGGRWAWYPGGAEVVGPPVYAPALVTFIGIGAGVAIGAALAAGTIGWIPLGPRESYHPWYHASPRYMQSVNYGRNVTNITINNYANRGAATSIPAAAMAGSRPVQSVARPVSAEELASAHSFSAGRTPLAPTAGTAGVTQGVARQYNLPNTRPVAAGPAVHPAAAGLGHPQAATPAAVHPGVNAPLTSAPRANAAAPAAGHPAGAPATFARPAPAATATAPSVQHPASPPAVTHPAPQTFNRQPQQPAAVYHPAPAPQNFNRPAPEISHPAPAPQNFNRPAAEPSRPAAAPRPSGGGEQHRERRPGEP